MIMRSLKLLTYVACSTLLSCALGACSDDEKTITPAETFQLSQAPDFTVYSGSNLIGSTFGTRAANVNGNLWYQNWKRPTNITEEERQAVIEAFSQKREGAKNTLQVTWKNYWVQQVYKGESTYEDGYGQNIGVASDKMNHLQAFNNLKTEVISWWPYEESISVYDGQYEHVNNFNAGNNTTVYTDDETHEQFIGTTLMVNMGTDGRDEQFAYHNSIDSKYHYEYIILEVNGGYYVGFDFFANGTEEYPANKNMDVERDWIFNDWIVKISPAQLKDDDSTPEPLNVEPTGPVDPVDPGQLKGEVEVNLSMNAVRDVDDYITTKLSIHVRDTADVEVFIPVTPEYYCEADDMDIVLSHRLEVELHSPQAQYVTYDINGHTVTATVAFETGGIRVTTQGITAEVLKYLRDTYADGLTIEVWNYYNANAVAQGRDVLKQMLDQSTVTFTRDPDRYVNAFAKLGEGQRNELDCTVTPPAAWSGTANDGTQNYNVIYTK